MPTACPATHSLDHVVNFLLTVVASTPYQKARFSGDLAGHLIVARLIAFRPAKSEAEEGVEARRVMRNWTEAEVEALKAGMLAGLKDVDLLSKLDKSVAQIGRKRHELIDGPFGLRKWEEGEFMAMLQFVQRTGENWRMVELQFSRPRNLLRHEYEAALRAEEH
jgi:hypothetical protein